jgi:hypothetical protein
MEMVVVIAGFAKSTIAGPNFYTIINDSILHLSIINIEIYYYLNLGAKRIVLLTAKD